MKLVLIFFFLFPTALYSQDMMVFFENYQKNIDPENKIGTIKSITQKRHFVITNLSNGQTQNYINQCSNLLNTESCMCLESLNGSTLPAERISIPSEYESTEDLIKFNLQYVFINGDINRFTFLSENDSITVIEERVTPGTTKVYTFNTKNRELISSTRTLTSPGLTFNEETRYLVFTRIESVLMPSKIFIVSNLFTASVELLEAKFEYHNTPRGDR